MIFPFDFFYLNPRGCTRSLLAFLVSKNEPQQTSREIGDNTHNCAFGLETDSPTHAYCRCQIIKTPVMFAYL